MTVDVSVATAVYRLFDEDGTLLYVGASVEPDVRVQTHRRDQKWGGKVARHELLWFESRDAALAAEREAIKAELPLHNVVHSARREEQAIRRRHELFESLIETAGAIGEGFSYEVNELADELRRHEVPTSVLEACVDLVSSARSVREETASWRGVARRMRAQVSVIANVPLPEVTESLLRWGRETDVLFDPEVPDWVKDAAIDRLVPGRKRQEGSA